MSRNVPTWIRRKVLISPRSCSKPGATAHAFHAPEAKCFRNKGKHKRLERKAKQEAARQFCQGTFRSLTTLRLETPAVFQAFASYKVLFVDTLQVPISGLQSRPLSKRVQTKAEVEASTCAQGRGFSASLVVCQPGLEWLYQWNRARILEQQAHFQRKSILDMF